jgi:hypothetical protein
MFLKHVDKNKSISCLAVPSVAVRCEDDALALPAPNPSVYYWNFP